MKKTLFFFLMFLSSFSVVAQKTTHNFTAEGFRMVYNGERTMNQSASQIVVTIDLQDSIISLVNDNPEISKFFKNTNSFRLTEHIGNRNGNEVFKCLEGYVFSINLRRRIIMVGDKDRNFNMHSLTLEQVSKR